MAKEKFEMRTKSGHSFWDMASMLQAAIRRGDVVRAGYAANELFGRYTGFLWRRLLIISAEDCYGIMTKEIVALKQAEEMMKKDDETIFVSKAIVLLCYAKKNRDADYFACNLMHSDHPIPDDQIEHHPIEEFELEGGVIPKWVYSWHTLKGRIMGMDVVNSIEANQECLKPRQTSMFDNMSWDRDINICLQKHNPQHRRLPYTDGKPHLNPDGTLPHIEGVTK